MAEMIESADEREGQVSRGRCGLQREVPTSEVPTRGTGLQRETKSSTGHNPKLNPTRDRAAE